MSMAVCKQAVPKAWVRISHSSVEGSLCERECLKSTRDSLHLPAAGTRLSIAECSSSSFLSHQFNLKKATVLSSTSTMASSSSASSSTSGSANGHSEDGGAPSSPTASTSSLSSFDPQEEFQAPLGEGTREPSIDGTSIGAGSQFGDSDSSENGLRKSRLEDIGAEEKAVCHNVDKRWLRGRQRLVEPDMPRQACWINRWLAH